MPVDLRLPATLAVAALALSACAPSRPVLAPAPAPMVAAPPEDLAEASVVLDRKAEAVDRGLLGDAAYDLPVEANSWVQAELDFLVDERRDVVARWMERGDPYRTWVRSVMRDEGVPGDLYYLGMIESAFLPTVRSRAGAVGLWQFMAGTARTLGLRVDSVVDERMDPVRSTRAAARHLRSLRDEMGDWPLAAAAYNAGTGRVSRGLEALGVTDYWALAEMGGLPEETKRYVPRLYAMDIIAHRRAFFGFGEAVDTVSFAFDSIQVETATPLADLAKLGGATLEDLQRLNPHLVRGSTPDGGYWVWVPTGEGMAMQRAWLAASLHRRETAQKLAAREPAKQHVVRSGDTLWGIARRYGTTVSALRGANRLDDHRPIQPGMRLTIPS